MRRFNVSRLLARPCRSACQHATAFALMAKDARLTAGEDLDAYDKLVCRLDVQDEVPRT